MAKHKPMSPETKAMLWISLFAATGFALYLYYQKQGAANPAATAFSTGLPTAVPGVSASLLDFSALL